jgi:hypothetical protein
MDFIQNNLDYEINKFNKIFLNLIMKYKKKYEKLYNKIKNIDIKNVYKIKHNILEKEIFCGDCTIQPIEKECFCCVKKPIFPSYDILYSIMNNVQQLLFNKKIYLCVKLIYDNKENNELIERVCKKIYDISGIEGLEFVQTILHSIT